MNTRAVSASKTLLLSSFVSLSLALAVSAQDIDRRTEYEAFVASSERFNEVQRNADMPEIAIPTYEEWLSTQAVSDSAQVASESTSQAVSRDTLNLGLRNSDGDPTTVSEIQTARRSRLWAKSVDLLQAHRKEMDDARKWAEEHGFAEQALLPEGGVIGLVGLRNGIPRYNVTYNAGSADTIGVDEVWPGGGTGLGVTGSNVVIGIWDGGDVLTNQLEFTSGGSSSRAVDQDGISSLPIDAHPTAVAGTLSAAGIASFPAPAESPKGMSFQAQLWTYDWDLDIETEMNSAYANDIHVSNHSYGEQAGWGFVTILFPGPIVTNAWWANLAVSTTESHLFGWYSGDATNTDAVAYGNPFSLPVWAAGNDRDDAAVPPGVQYVAFSNGAAFFSTAPRSNDYYDSGYDTISDHGIAKNVLTVGAVYKISGGYTGPSSVSIAPFSSFGPTDDGRIKPDVVAAGVDLTTPIRNPSDPNNPFYYVTSTGNTNSPSYATGTSFSSPSAAGVVGLLVDLRKRLTPNFPFWSSTLKTIITHTADDAQSVGPDYKTGWGLINAQQATLLLQQDYDDGGKQYIKEVLLNDGDYIEFPVSATGNVPLKVSIGWTDPAGPAQPELLDPTNSVLVNDFDLRIVSPSGTTNFPWTLNPAAPSNSATTGDNIIDNSEQVVVTNPTASAVYTVRITHKGALVDDTGASSAQGVSIIISGIIPEPRPETPITALHTDGADEHIEWSSVVGQNYVVQTDTNLFDQAWTNLSAEISASKTNIIWESGLSPSGEVRFYRLYKTN